MSQQKTMLNSVREYIRRPYTDVGGYPLVLWMDDCAALCPVCAKNNYRLISQSTRHNTRDGWKAAGVDVLWEGVEYCAHCNKKIESAYGEDEGDENE